MMRATVTVRGLTIGSNPPRIIVPIVESSYAEILAQAEDLQVMQIDMVEWRADYFDEVFDSGRLLYTLSGLRSVLEDIPLLFTFRTRAEGGEKDISPQDYLALNTAVAQSGKVDLIDVEVFFGGDLAQRNIDAIHEAGVLVVGSNHDFHATPSKEEMIRRLRNMQEMRADIPKLAVMPTSTGDVLTLLAATNEMYEQYADRPIITVSMSPQGLISRLYGEVFGSAMTFAAAGQVSAPGQIPVKQLTKVLEIIHNAL